MGPDLRQTFAGNAKGDWLSRAERGVRALAIPCWVLLVLAAVLVHRLHPLFGVALCLGLAALYSQALVGMVALVGQWWLDDRSLDKNQLAAHLVNLAYNGLAHLDPQPGLS